MIDCDSSQIEARVLAWLAGQEDLVEDFANKEDVYVKMASRIYNLPEDQISKDQRFVGKTTILGAGYGMGSVKFQAQLKTFGVDIDLEEARRIIDIYRKTNGNISRLWRDSKFMIKNLANKVSTRVGCHDVIRSLAKQSAVSLPSGLVMRYEDLRAENGERGYQYTYKTRKGRTKIYGGKFVENACQALARCIIGEQMLRISAKYKIVLTVHDSLVVCVKEDEVQEARTYIEDCMRTVPTWAHGLPLDCESGVAKAYGDCE